MQIHIIAVDPGQKERKMADMIAVFYLELW